MSYVTFGQVFKKGAVPSGQYVSGHVSNVDKDVQCDAMAVHGDGSLRHGIFTYNATTGQTLTLKTAESPLAGAALTRANLPSGFSVEVTLNVSGDALYTSAMTKADIEAATVYTHLSGPLCSEWIVTDNVTKTGPTNHPHLMVYYHIRLYVDGNVRVDYVVENGWTFEASPQDYTYDWTLKLNGVTKGSASALAHYRHCRWHKVFWLSGAPNIYTRPDTRYLRDSKAVPNYDDVTITEVYLDSLRSSVAPMDNGDHRDYMPDSGYQPGIGLLPLWDSLYIVSGDARAFQAMLANTDGAGAYRAHYRERVSGRPISIADYPSATIQNSSVPSGSSSNPHTIDQAHQPSMAYLAYLATGDYFYLEELQFWATWNFLYANATSYRDYEKGIFGVEIRGQAWALRTLGQVAYITPDADPLKAHFVASIGHNMTYKEASYSSNPGANNLGALLSYDGYAQFKPWMDDFYTASLNYLVDLGFSEAVPMRDWKAVQPVGRMGTTEYCYIKASTYVLATGTSNSNWFTDFTNFYEQNFGTNTSCPLGSEMEGYPSLPSGYLANLYPALAAAVDAGATNAGAAWNRMIGSAVLPDFTNTPIWAVIPRILPPVTAGVIAQMESGTWAEISGTNLDAVFPSPLPDGIEGPISIMKTWCGGAYDTQRDRLIVWGGGHKDYAGNELYVYDINSESWSRITEPSSPTAENLSHYADGKPSSRHTYNALQYAANVDEFFSLTAGATFGDPGGFFHDVDSFDFDTLTWDTSHPNNPSATNLTYGGISAYDSVAGKLWYHGGFSGPLTSYDPNTKLWTEYGGVNNLAIYSTAAIDTVRNNLVSVGGYGGERQIYIWDLDNPNSSATVPSSSGSSALETSSAPGFVYNPDRDRFVGWSGGSTLYELNPSTWEWTTVSLSGNNTVTPTAAEPQGTFGRFQYIPSQNAYIIVNKTNENVYIFKV